LTLTDKEKSTPLIGRCQPSQPAGISFAAFLVPIKEKQSGEAVLQNFILILLICNNKRLIFHLLFCNISTKCTPRPIEKCNCTFRNVLDI